MTRSTSTAERWFFTGLAVLYALVAVAGFGPRGYLIATGELANPPLATHLHGITMAAWLVLLVLQAALIGTNRRRDHRRIGLLSLGLVPLMTVFMLEVAVRTFDPENHGAAIATIQVRRLAIFGLCIVAALGLRARAPDAHKRAMFVGTAVLLDAALLRMPWLPDPGLGPPLGPQVYQLLLLAPLVAYDLWTIGRLHRVTILGLTAFVLTSALVAALW